VGVGTQDAAEIGARMPLESILKGGKVLLSKRKNKTKQNANGGLGYRVHWYDQPITYHATLREALLNIWDRGAEYASMLITPEGEIQIGKDIFHANK